MRKCKILYFLMLVTAVMFSVSANAADKNEGLKYDLVSAGVGAQGTYLCKVSVYTKKGKTTDADLKRAAVHGVIFKGVAGGNGVATQKPMANPTIFADDGPYMAYANVEPGTIGRKTTAKKEVCVSAVVSVSKDELRKYLEKAGIVRGLGSMF